MRCEKPWFASFGATKKTSTSAVVTSRSDAVASAGREIRAVRPTAGIVAAAALLGDDILEGCPANDGKQQVVEREEAEVASGRVCHSRSDAAHHDRDRERQEEQRQEQLARAGRNRHRAEERADRADADIGERDTAHCRTAQRPEEERVHRQRDDLRGDEESERRQRLAEPDRAAVARGEYEPVQHPLLPLWHKRPAKPEQRCEEDRDPEQPTRGELRWVR